MIDQYRTDKALRKIFVALKAAPEHKLQRAWIQQRTLDRMLSAAELNELRQHCLVQRYITIELLQIVRQGPKTELWTLKETALEWPEELDWIFGFRSGMQGPDPFDSVAQSEDSEGSPEEDTDKKPETLLDLIVAYLSGRRYIAPRPIFRDTLHVYYDREGSEVRVEIRDRTLFAEGVERSPIVLVPAKPAPNYKLVLEGQRVVWALKELSVYDEEPSPLYSGAPMRELFSLPPLSAAEKGEITHLCYSPRDPGRARESRSPTGLTGSENGDVPADWMRRCNGWG